MEEQQPPTGDGLCYGPDGQIRSVSEEIKRRDKETARHERLARLE